MRVTLPEASPLVYDYEAEDKVKFIWKKIGSEEEEPKHYSLSPTQSLRTSIQSKPIYFHDFEMHHDCLITHEYPIPKNLLQLQGINKNCTPTTNHPEDYELFGDFEGSNVHKIFYCKYDVVKVVLRGDSNSLGYCQWFYFGLRILKPRKELRITVVILNLRHLMKDQPIYVKRDEGVSQIIGQSQISKHARKILEKIDENGTLDRGNLTKATHPQYEVIDLQLARQQSQFRTPQTFKFIPTPAQSLILDSRLPSSPELDFVPKKYRYISSYYTTCSFTYVHRPRPQIEEVFLSYSKPYVYSTLKTFLKGLPIEWKQTTMKGATRPIPVLETGQGRKVLIIARARPVDAETSHVIQQLIESVTLKARQLLQLNIIPMLNPDGVFLGNSKTDLNGSRPKYTKDAFMTIELLVDYHRTGYCLTHSQQFVHFLNQYVNLPIRTPKTITDINNYVQIYLPQNADLTYGPAILQAIVDYVQHITLEELQSSSPNNKKRTKSITKSEHKKLKFHSDATPNNKDLKVLKITSLDNEVGKVSFKSSTEHSDDMLNNSYFEQFMEKKPEDIETHRRGSVTSFNNKDFEIMNQLKNIEWNNQTNRTNGDNKIISSQQITNNQDNSDPPPPARKSMKIISRNLSQEYIRDYSNEKNQQYDSPVQKFQNHLLNKKLNQSKTSAKLVQTSQQSFYQSSHFKSQAPTVQVAQNYRIHLRNPFIPSRQEISKEYTLKSKYLKFKTTTTFTHSNHTLIIYPKLS